MRVRINYIALVLALYLTMFTQISVADEPRILAVVVSSNIDVSATKAISANELKLIYWRKKLYWSGGVRMHPVNLYAEHAIRQMFSKAVLGGLPMTQTDYWNGLYYHGVSPPHSVQSEEAVLRYVAETKGSIGYVDACNVDGRVKAILWIYHDQITANSPDNIQCQ